MTDYMIWLCGLVVGNAMGAIGYRWRKEIWAFTVSQVKRLWDRYGPGPHVRYGGGA